MKENKNFHPCFCTFIPPHVLEHMAKASEAVVGEEVREAARLSIIQDNQLRINRSSQVADVATLLGTTEAVMAPPPGTAGREIFNAGLQIYRHPQKCPLRYRKS